MGFRTVRVEDSVGMVLPHDMTRIIPGEQRGAAFRKGHIVQAEDIPELKKMGKDHIYILELMPQDVHEDPAALRLAQAVVGENVYLTKPVEGKVSIKAACDGLTVINREAVIAINQVEYAVVSTLHTHERVKKDQVLAGVRVVPLVVPCQMVEQAEQIAKQNQGVISVYPLQPLKLGAVITGSEVYYGRIKDRYAPVLEEKARSYGAQWLGVRFCPDNQMQITKALTDFKNEGAQIIIASGGMSVDPDDVTPEAIRQTGAQVLTYGAPVLPGAMFMLAYWDKVAVMGLPACGMYAQTTVLDLVLPRILAEIRLTKQDFSCLGYGGLCDHCSVCTFPHCGFGKH